MPEWTKSFFTGAYGWVGMVLGKVWDWYRETHTSAHTKMLSNRSQVYTMVMVAATFVLVYDGVHNKVRRDWNEALAVLTLGGTAAKVWRRDSPKGDGSGNPASTG